jgi:hypothetical protein
MRYFCDNEGCCKALGDCRLVLEELRAEAHWHQLLAGRVTAFIAKPQLVAAHSLELNEICAVMCDLMGRPDQLEVVRRENPRREPW